MAEPASHLSPAPRLATAENAMRPKVLRRPAQFSSPATTSKVVSLPGTRQELPIERPSVTPSPRIWQDDGQFGIALIVLLLLVNGAAAFWLSHTPTNTPLTIIQQPSTMTASDEASDDTAALNETR